MIPVDTKGCPRLQVVEAFQVGELTKSGWILLGTTEDTRIESLRKEIPPLQDPHQPYATYPANAVNEQVLKTVTVYVMGLDEKSALAEADAKLQEITSKLRELEAKLCAENMAVEAAGKKLREAESKADSANRQVTTLQAQVTTLRTQEGTHLTEIQSLRTQVANLTQAFGQIRVNTEPAKVEGNPEASSAPDVENTSATRFERVGSDT